MSCPRRVRWVAPIRVALALLIAAMVLSGCAKHDTGARGVSPTPTPSPVTLPGGFVHLSDVDPTIQQDMRYATDHNFVGRPITGYDKPVCILSRVAADALHRVQIAARARGYSLKVYDCYRPQRAVDDFIRWIGQPGDQRMKAEFYPATDKSTVVADGYIADRSGHSRGSTMDLTLVPLPVPTQRPYRDGEPLTSCVAPAAARFPDNSVDMGTGFDCFDPRAHTRAPAITNAPLANRLLLLDLMNHEGFKNYVDEWWHYTLAGEPFPSTYFDFPVH